MEADEVYVKINGFEPLKELPKGLFSGEEIFILVHSLATFCSSILMDMEEANEMRSVVMSLIGSFLESLPSERKSKLIASLKEVIGFEIEVKRVVKPSQNGMH